MSNRDNAIRILFTPGSYMSSDVLHKSRIFLFQMFKQPENNRLMRLVMNSEEGATSKAGDMHALIPVNYP